MRNKNIDNKEACCLALVLIICLLGNFACFLLSQNQHFQKKSLRNTIRVSNILDPDQAQHFVGPDLGPNCLQRLSADDTSRQRVNISGYFLCLQIVFIVMCYQYEPPTYDDYTYPALARVFGNVLAMIPLVPLPVSMFYQLYITEGTFSQVLLK